MQVKRKLDGQIEGKVPEVEGKDLPEPAEDVEESEEDEEGEAA